MNRRLQADRLAPYGHDLGSLRYSPLTQLTSANVTYFFAKSIDKLRPGGVMALITSRYTMDKQDSGMRRYLQGGVVKTELRAIDVHTGKIAWKHALNQPRGR